MTGVAIPFGLVVGGAVSENFIIAGDLWGLGLPGQLFLGINPDTGVDPPTWTTLGGGLAFSATYN
jgi:hypothetical protein